MQTVYVTYPGDAMTRFARNYYIETHLPLVLKSWRKYGLETVAAFFPEGSGAGMIAICACNFRDEQSVRDAFASSEAKEVMADIPHFTAATPAQSLATRL